jgi:hypothetical protein
VPSTLLGPEGSSRWHALWAILRRTTHLLGLRLGSGARGDPRDGFRPYLENFIVDASIKVRSLCSDKLLRAHGGCLGIKSRRRP